MLVSAAPGGIAASAAVATAFKALEAGATTGHAKACTSYDTGDDREDNEACNNYRNNNRPPGKVSIGMTGMKRGAAYLQYAAAMQLSQLEKEFLTLSMSPVIPLCAINLGRRLASIATLIRGMMATSRLTLRPSQVLRGCGLYYCCCSNGRIEIIETFRRASYGNSLDVSVRKVFV